VRTIFQLATILAVIILFSFSSTIEAEPKDEPAATFSIVGFDPETGELGVAVASRFFAVGNVVPWAKAGVGAVATQSYANTSFGWRGLDLLEKDATPAEAMQILLRNDDNPSQRQVGIVSADGQSATYSGDGCLAWAGGRNGPNYACQGNILAGEAVVAALEETFLSTKGTLADRLYAALLAGDAEGGDSRGKQSAAILVVAENAGYGGYTDRAIDIRVDDHEAPFKELGRLLDIAQMNYSWNVAWTFFSEKKFEQALEPMERTARISPEYPEVLYDLAVIRLANNMKNEALEALVKAIELNPKLAKAASVDGDFDDLKEDIEFKRLIKTSID